MRLLHRLILDRIAAQGPMSVAEYMALCLQHPEHGYYITRDTLGRDFVTAPEISQMFGELLGLCLAQAWLDQGAPAAFTLAELGPGRGTLMADILRAAGRVPGFVGGADVVLLESSPALRARQSEALAAHHPRWIEAVGDLPEQPLFLVANEFFDALPIRQFIRAEGPLWHERQVAAPDGALGFGLGGLQTVAPLEHRLEDTKPGDLVELCPQACSIVSVLAHRIAAHRGVALVVDYGDWRSLGDTLQAMSAGQPVDPLATPGEADLTAHVDFEALVAAAAPATHTKLTPQGVLLERLGISARAETLARGLSGAALETHEAAFHRLTSPLEMGNLFKGIGILPKGAMPPAGLEL